MQLSIAAKRLEPSATLAMNELIATRRAKGEQILHMGFGESPFPVHPLIQKALCENADKRSYLPTQGILQLRERMAAFYKANFNLDYSPDQIIVGPGSKTLIFDSLVSLVGPLFLPAPSWVSYQHQGRLLGKEVHFIKTKPGDSYRLTPDAFLNALQNYASDLKKQKILLLNYPCNPTGHSFSTSQLWELASIAREHNVIIISDEIYALLSFHEQDHHSIAEFYPEGTIITGGLSKDHSMGGYRVGVMLLPADEPDLMRVLLSIGSETWSCVSAPIQFAALEAYRLDPRIQNYIKDCTAIHELVTKYVHHKIVDMGIRCPAPQGAFYLFPDWNKWRKTLSTKGVTNSVALAEMLLREWNVASLPGSAFGMPANNLCIRIATVDYDGANAIAQFKKNRRQAWKEPNQFVPSIAPQLVKACEQIGKFTESLGMI